MNILLVNKDFYGGGAAMAAKRLFYALKKDKSLEVNMLIQKHIPHEYVHSIYKAFAKQRSLWNLALEKALFYFQEASSQERFQFSAAIGGSSIADYKIVKEADIVHLHWINQGFLSLNAIEQLLTLNKPIIWTMHDMWTFTGGCHYPGMCVHFKNECGNCHFLKRPSPNDISHRLFLKKKELFNHPNFYWVGCSSWIANMLKSGNLIRSENIFNIPNPIDSELYTITNKIQAKELFSLPRDKKIVLFGAAKITDTRKGLHYLLEALNKLPEELQNNMILVTFGKTNLDSVPVKNHKHISFISDEKSIVELYNAADVLVVPSLEDNLPNTIMEAMSCSTPVVAFNIGGIPDMIDHLVNGYLAKEKNAEDLAAGISYILQHPMYHNVSSLARLKVVSEFSESKISSAYKSIYQKALQQNGK